MEKQFPVYPPPLCTRLWERLKSEKIPGFFQVRRLQSKGRAQTWVSCSFFLLNKALQWSDHAVPLIPQLRKGFFLTPASHWCPQGSCSPLPGSVPLEVATPGRHTHTHPHKKLSFSHTAWFPAFVGQLLMVSMKLTGTTQTFAFFSIRVLLAIIKLMLNALNGDSNIQCTGFSTCKMLNRWQSILSSS